MNTIMSPWNGYVPNSEKLLGSCNINQRREEYRRKFIKLMNAAECEYTVSVDRIARNMPITAKFYQELATRNYAQARRYREAWLAIDLASV